MILRDMDVSEDVVEPLDGVQSNVSPPYAWSTEKLKAMD